MRDPLKFKEGAKTLQRATICRGRTTRNTLFFSWSILSREEPLCGHVIGLVFTHRLGLKAEADINYCVIIVRHCVSRIALLPSTQPFRTLSQLKVGLAALNLHPFASDSLVLDRRPTRKRPFFSRPFQIQISTTSSSIFSIKTYKKKWWKCVCDEDNYMRR